MGVYEEINFTITGQIKGDRMAYDKKLFHARLLELCARYEIELEENF